MLRKIVHQITAAGLAHAAHDSPMFTLDQVSLLASLTLHSMTKGGASLKPLDSHGDGQASAVARDEARMDSKRAEIKYAPDYLEVLHTYKSVKEVEELKLAAGPREVFALCKKANFSCGSRGCCALHQAEWQIIQGR